MFNSYIVIKARVQEIIQIIFEKKKTNITRLVREFHVFYQHLLNRYNDLNLRESYNFALTMIEEFVIY